MTFNGIALVTGASRGIGRSIAHRLSRDGFKLALNDLISSQGVLLEVQDEIIKNGGQATVFIADISVEEEVEAMVSDIVEKLGALDVMIANAGVCIAKPFLDTSVEDFRRILSVNAIGTYLCYKFAAKQMIKQGRGGRIIGASSLAGKQGWPFVSLYSSSKFAIRGLTQATAVELAKHGITVNAYAPGPVDTEMLRGLREDITALEPTEIGDPQLADSALAKTSPLGRDVTPDDIAGLVSFLVSEEASMITGKPMIFLSLVCQLDHVSHPNVTGQSISINGGLYFD